MYEKYKKITVDAMSTDKLQEEQFLWAKFRTNLKQVLALNARKRNCR